MKKSSEIGIFKNYDIRGKYPKEVNQELFHKIGKVLKKVGFRKVAVGRDARLSSELLHRSLLRGLIDSRAEIIDLGVLTSPMLSLFCVTHKIKGAMITASHNPKEYNGIKFIDTDGEQLGYDRLLKKIEKLLLKGEPDNVTKKGEIKKIDFLRDYVYYLQKRFNIKSLNRKKVVIDCSNGVGGIPLSKLKQYGFNAILINKNPDGNFPNHGPDQTKKINLRQLQKEVLKNHGDLGIILDGDGDRCAFVDDKGKIVSSDISFLILALDELRKSHLKKPKILFNLTYSRIVPEVLQKAGAKPLALRVGNPYYKKVLHEDKKAIMAGEYSGHIMYNDNYGIDDGTYAGLKMISALLNSGKNLSELSLEYKKYYSTGQIAIEAPNPGLAIKSVEEKYSKYKISKIDGISIDMKDVWFNLRQSNTEPLVRLIIEGKSKKMVEEEKRKIIKIIGSKTV